MFFFERKIITFFHKKYFDDYDRAKNFENSMKEKGVIYASRDPNNVMSVMSLADIVVYNRVGTPSMIALLLDIPSFCFL